MVGLPELYTDVLLRLDMVAAEATAGAAAAELVAGVPTSAKHDPAPAVAC